MNTRRYRPVILLLILMSLMVFFTTEIRFTFTLLRDKFAPRVAAAVTVPDFDNAGEQDEP